MIPKILKADFEGPAFPIGRRKVGGDLNVFGPRLGLKYVSVQYLVSVSNNF
jgi:hypothetical protein